VQLSIMAAIHIPERPFLPPSPPDTHKRSLDDLPDAPDPTRKRRRTHAALPTPEDSTAAGTPTEDVPRDATGRPRIYACTFAGCTARFSRPCRREEHERRHTGARPFVCGLPAIPQPGDKGGEEGEEEEEHCGKTFARADHLARHERHAHAGERPHACPAPGCGKRFATAQRLRAHEAAHRRRREFACPGAPGQEGGGGCGAVFRKKSTLAAHVARVHVGVKPFPCGRADGDTGAPCRAAYNTAGKLAEHVRKRHAGARYFCTLCSTTGEDDPNKTAEDGPTAGEAFLGFASLAALLLHKSSAHPPPARKKKTARADSPDDDDLAALLDPNLHHAFRRAAEAAAIATAAAATRAAEGVRREQEHRPRTLLPCLLAPRCPAHLPSEGLLAAHCAGTHGMAPVDIAEALRERAAAEGGAFWVGGAEAAIEEMLALVDE
jgi:hypothetical protein